MLELAGVMVTSITGILPLLNGSLQTIP